MNNLHGYYIGSFISEVDRCKRAGDVIGVLKAVDKFFPHAQEIERAIFEQIKKEREKVGQTIA